MSRTPIALKVTLSPSLDARTWVLTQQETPLLMRDPFKLDDMRSSPTVDLFTCSAEDAPEETWTAVGKLAHKSEIDAQMKMSAHEPPIVPKVLAYCMLDAKEATHLFPARPTGSHPPYLLLMQHMPFALQNDMATLLASAQDVRRLFDELERALTAMTTLVAAGFHNDAYVRNVLAYKDAKSGYHFVLADFGKLIKTQDAPAAIGEWLDAFHEALAKYIVRWQGTPGLPPLPWIPKMDKVTLAKVNDLLYDILEADDAGTAALCLACNRPATGTCVNCLQSCYTYCSMECLEQDHVCPA